MMLQYDYSSVQSVQHTYMRDEPGSRTGTSYVELVLIASILTRSVILGLRSCYFTIIN